MLVTLAGVLTAMESKRVKFQVESKEFDREEFAGEEGNDLDLDTVKASRNRAHGLKEFDSEGSDESSEEEIQVDSADSTDSTDSGEEDQETDSIDFDDRQIPLEPFNLRNDREEGSFDADGFYVKKYDEEADQDRWMAHLTPSDIRKARKAHVEREQRQGRKEASKCEEELWEELAEEMSGFGELSVLGIITSLRTANASSDHPTRPRAPFNRNRLKKLQKEQGMLPASPERDKMTPENQAKLEKLTELADALMDLGHFGVYEVVRRDISRSAEQSRTEQE